MMNIDDMQWILHWFHSQCDGDWEHSNGISFGTLDNPGWYLKVSLEGTKLEQKKFETLDIERSEQDWIYCSVDEGLFKGYGGVFNLPEIIKVFRDWVNCNDIIH